MWAETWSPTLRCGAECKGALRAGPNLSLGGGHHGIFPAAAEGLEQIGCGDVMAQPSLYQAVLRLQQRALAVEQGQQILGTGLVTKGGEPIGFLSLLGGGFQRGRTLLAGSDRDQTVLHFLQAD